MKHPQHSPADVKGVEPPQKTEASLLVKDFSVFSPVKFVVNEHPQIFVVFNDVPTPQDGDWGHWCPGSIQIHHQLLGLCCVELQVVQLTPCDEAVNHSPGLSLITLADTSNDSRVIRKLLKMARLWSGSWSPWCKGWRGKERAQFNGEWWRLIKLVKHSMRRRRRIRGVTVQIPHHVDQFKEGMGICFLHTPSNRADLLAVWTAIKPRRQCDESNFCRYQCVHMLLYLWETV